MIITVVMSIYNEPIEWIIQSVESILNQTFSEFEFIIINDNPNNTENKRILKEYSVKDSRIIIIENELNIGLTKSLNIGFKLAKGKYIARMDADDISLPNRFIEQYSYMESHREVVACGSFIDVFGEINRLDTSLPSCYDDFKNMLFLKNPLPHPTAFLRNEIIKKNNITYNEDLKFAQDYGLWVSLSRFGKLTNVPKVLLKYRVNGNQVSISRKVEQLQCAQQIRTELLKYELNGMEIQYDLNNLPSLFKKIIFSKKRSERRSCLLLLVFLSYPKHTLYDVFLLLIKINSNILVNNFKLIIQQILFKTKYPSLL